MYNKKKNFEEVCREINWPELSKQKQTLLKLKSTLTGKDKQNVEGILKLINELQDAATDVHGVKESEVYPVLAEVRKNILKRKKRNPVRGIHNFLEDFRIKFVN